MSEQDQPPKEDAQREAAFDRMMTEGRQLIDQAKEAAVRLDATLGEVCDKDGISDYLKSDQCPEDLRQIAQEDLEKLMQELEQEEQVLASESRGPVSPTSTGKPRPGPRPGMNKV